MPRELIPNVTIKNMFNNDWRVPKRDDDGSVIWQSGCDLCDRPEPNSQPELIPATASNLIRELLLNIGQLQKIQKPMDGRNATKLWNQIERKREDGNLAINTAQYTWLHSLLTRKIPGENDATVASSLYGLNEWYVIEQLKPLHERAALEEEDFVDEEESEEEQEKN